MQKKLYLVIIIVIFLGIISSNIAKAADWALNFDGDDYVEVPDDSSLRPADAITIEAWFKANTFSNFYPTIIGKGWWQDPYPPYWFMYLYNQPSYPDGLWFEYYDGSQSMYFGGHNLITYNQWQQVVVTGEGNSWKMYMNGDEVDSVTAPAPVSVQNFIYIGSGDPNDSSAEHFYFDGAIDKVRIYSRVLSANEVEQHYNGVFSDETGLVGLWNFNEGSGLVVYDGSGYGNDGDIYGAAWVGEILLPETLRGIKNDSPTVKLETQFFGTYRDKLPVSYSATDTDFGIGDLRLRPVDVFYSEDGGYRWHKIAEEQPREGIYIFDTTKVPDGKNYKIIVGALDGYYYSGHAYSEIFAIDNTGPTFDIAILPLPPVKEKDTIELKIISSEELKAPPEIKITHQGTETKIITASGSGKEFFASYYVFRGYPGKTVISITGEDLVGNVGETISSGRSFLIERYGPPAPEIEAPTANQIFTQPTISLIGSGELDTEVVVTLNEATKWIVQPSSDGSFKIDDITLSLTTENKGYNTLSIVAFNQKREDSEEIVLKLKLNSPPEISAISITSGEVLSGEKEITWTASDLNEDELVFSIEYSNDGGVTWDFIVSDFSTTSYKMDTTQLADGTNYFLRVTADDGTEKISNISKRFTIKNNLPHISLDIPVNYFTNINTPAFTGKVTGSEQNISSVEYSLDGGAAWQEALALDGDFDSLIEKIEISISDSLKEGKYTILVRAEDTLNRSVKISRSLNIDTTPPITPVIELPSLDGAVDDGMDTNLELDGLQTVFRGETEPEAKIELILEDEIYKTTANERGEFKIRDVTLWVHGLNKFSLSSSDLAGNVSQISGTVISNNPPQIFILNPQEGEFLADMEEIIWQARDPDNDLIVSQVLYQKEGEEWITLVKDLTVNVYNWNLTRLTSGDYKIKIIVADGMSEAEEILNVFIDNVAPQAAFTVLGPSLTTDIRPAFSGQASDDFSGIQYVEYSFNNIDWYKALIYRGYQTKRASFRFRHYFFLADGDYRITVRATDRAGNIAYSEFQDLTLDTTAPYIGSILISAGVLSLFPDEKGVINLFEDTSYKILFSVARKAKEITLSSKETIFDINFNQATLLWESEFNFEEPGDYPIEITTQDEAGNSQAKEITALKAAPWGIVYNKETGQPIKGAKATLFVFEQSANSWPIWDGQAFNQKNPQETDETGRYGFLAPSGKYRLAVEKPGFERVRSKELVIKNNYLINTDISLVEEKGFLNKILDYFKGIIGL